VGLAVVLGGSLPAAAAPRQVPPGFLGVVADGPLVDGTLRPAQVDREFNQMVVTGVESVRVVFYWDEAQPYPDAAHVPPSRASRFQDVEGVPTDFTSLDAMIARTTARGLAILAVVLRAPAWARLTPSLPYSPPRDPRTYAHFVAGLVRRYGPAGSFWTAHPELDPRPVRAWQVWNEPAGGALVHGPSVYWQDRQPFERRYLALLREARAAIKAVDPAAQVVLAGLFGASWNALKQIYTVGGRGLFDAVGIHVYTRLPKHVLVSLNRTRWVMNHYGDRSLPLMLTEVGWPSAAGRLAPSAEKDYDVTPRQQGARLRSMVHLLAHNAHHLRLTMIVWNNWISRDRQRNSPFDYSGLRRLVGASRVVAKPAQAALRAIARSLEGCAKAARADRCAAPAR
jgi:hypothetical protein